VSACLLDADDLLHTAETNLKAESLVEPSQSSFHNSKTAEVSIPTAGVFCIEVFLHLLPYYQMVTSSSATY